MTLDIQRSLRTRYVREFRFCPYATDTEEGQVLFLPSPPDSSPEHDAHVRLRAIFATFRHSRHTHPAIGLLLSSQVTRHLKPGLNRPVTPLPTNDAIASIMAFQTIDKRLNK